MSLAHQEETPSAIHPLDMLEQSVEENGWPFERSGRDELNLSVAGRWCDHHFCFTWREDLQSLHLSSAFDMRVNDSRRTDVANLLMYVNAKLWIGHFDLWPEDGTLIFRHAVEACEHYYPAFQFVLWGGKTAEEAVAAAVLECAGQA
jgi:hypothetical protein